MYIVKKDKSKLDTPQMTILRPAAEVSTTEGNSVQIGRELGIFVSNKILKYCKQKMGKNVLKEWRMNHYQNRCVIPDEHFTRINSGRIQM